MVLAVNAWDEDEATLKRFVRDTNLKQRILLNGSDVAERYKFGNSVPAVFWIDPNGVIVASEAGFDGPGSLRQKTELLLQGR